MSKQVDDATKIAGLANILGAGNKKKEIPPPPSPALPSVGDASASPPLSRREKRAGRQVPRPKLPPLRGLSPQGYAQASKAAAGGHGRGQGYERIAARAFRTMACIVTDYQ